MRDFLRDRIKFILAFITLGIFYIIFKEIDFFSVIHVLTTANPSFLAMALICSIFIIIFFAKRWQMVLVAMDFQISFRESLNIIMGVFPFASITPSIASDGIRALYIKDRVRPSIVIGSVLAERVLEFSVLLIFFIIGMLFENKFQFVGMTIILVVGISFFLIIAHTKINLPLKTIWNERLQNLFLSLKILTKSAEYFTIVTGYTVLIWILSILQILFFFHALGVDISIFTVMAGAPIAILIGQIPVTLGGAGTRDAAFILLFLQYANPERLLGVGLLFSFFRVWLPSIAGILFMRKMIKFNNLINRFI